MASITNHFSGVHHCDADHLNCTHSAFTWAASNQNCLRTGDPNNSKRQLRLTTLWRFSVEFVSQNGDNLVGLTVLGLALPSIVVISLGSIHAWSHFLHSGSIIDLLTSSKSVLLEVLLSLSVGCLSLVQTRVTLAQIRNSSPSQIVGLSRWPHDGCYPALGWFGSAHTTWSGLKPYRICSRAPLACVDGCPTSDSNLTS